MAGLGVTLHTVVAQLQERALGTQLSCHGQSMRMLPTSTQTRRNALAESGDARRALSGSFHSANQNQQTLRWTLSPSLSTALPSMQAKVHADREGSAAYKFCL